MFTIAEHNGLLENWQSDGFYCLQQHSAHHVAFWENESHVDIDYYQNSLRWYLAWVVQMASDDAKQVDKSESKLL